MLVNEMEDVNTYVLCASGRLKSYKAKIENAIANAVKLISQNSCDHPVFLSGVGTGDGAL
jgi:hypothetical protein